MSQVIMSSTKTRLHKKKKDTDDEDDDSERECRLRNLSLGESFECISDRSYVFKESDNSQKVGHVTFHSFRLNTP